MMVLLLACAHTPPKNFRRCETEVVTFNGYREDTVSVVGAPLPLADAPSEPLGALAPALQLTMRRVSGGHQVLLRGTCPTMGEWTGAWDLDVDLMVHGTVGGHPVMATRTDARVWRWKEGWAAVTDEPWASVVDPSLEQAYTKAMGLDMASGDLQLVGPARGDAPEVRLMWVPVRGKARVVRVWRPRVEP